MILLTAADSVGGQGLSRLTIDIDGSVLTTGLTVAGAVRGYNPHHRKNPSYSVSSIRTVRFEWLNRAARLVAPAGSQTLRLAINPAVRDAFTRAAAALDQAA